MLNAANAAYEESVRHMSGRKWVSNEAHNVLIKIIYSGKYPGKHPQLTVSGHMPFLKLGGQSFKFMSVVVY